jgi:PAS domain S-box-containing protein
MNKPTIRILIIEDDEDDFFIIREDIQRIPHQQLVIDWCPRYADGVEKMKRREYSIYFVDYFLGAKTGLELLKEAIAAGCQEPIILLTGKGNHTIDMEAMQAGAYDYLIKSELNIEKLERCIRYSLERASAAKALKENERKYRTIFERSNDMVFIANKDFSFRDINPAGIELLGYTEAELKKMNFFSVFTGITPVKNIQDNLSEKGVADDVEVNLLTKKKAVKDCILSMAREKDLDGEIYYQGIIHDISTLKKNERANLQLQKLAIAGRLVHTLAHEIRNPLNNISLSLSELTVQSGTNGNEHQMYLDIIKRNSSRIGDIISELLNSSRPASIGAQKKALQDILDESIESAMDRMTLKKIKLSKVYAPKKLEILCDAEKLKIAFLNIIINAIEAMDEDKGQLVITIKSGGSEHTVMIKDNGSGISQENLVHLFEPYFTSKRNGMGLGLAATLNILQSHHAAVDVQSQLKKGTIFTVTFKSPA